MDTVINRSGKIHHKAVGKHQVAFCVLSKMIPGINKEVMQALVYLVGFVQHIVRMLLTQKKVEIKVSESSKNRIESGLLSQHHFSRFMENDRYVSPRKCCTYEHVLMSKVHIPGGHITS